MGGKAFTGQNDWVLAATVVLGMLPAAPVGGPVGCRVPMVNPEKNSSGLYCPGCCSDRVNGPAILTRHIYFRRNVRIVL